VTDRSPDGVRVLASRYQVGELLGRGGMADVHLGTDTRLGRRVAIKLLKPTLANDPSFRLRFRQEAQAAARMAHPTIVRVFDAGEETVRDPSGVEIQVPFIVMEYVDGRLLSDLIAEGPLDPAEAQRIADGVLTALEYSHRAGVVHRDIKPGNIMIARNGQVKVVDFGIARAISDASATIAQTSAILGTAQYFSPEQARGESLDARTDLYSTGVVIYEMLTGRPPFSGGTAVQVAYQHVSEAPVPPSALRPALSPALNAVVLRSLSKDRFDRYQSAADFREDMKIAGEGRVPDRTPVEDDDFSATLFGVNPASEAGSAATLRRLSSEEDDRVPRTQPRPPVAWIWSGIAVMAVVVVAVLVWVFSLQAPSLTENVSIRVPDVVGQNAETGQQRLEDRRLTVDTITEVSDQVPEGAVIRTQPQAGTSVGPGTEITVWVSSGTATVRVPDLAYMSEEEARAALQEAGLVYGESRTTTSPNVGDGVVITSEPGPDATDVRAGGTVDLLVSNGMVEVPSVVGEPVTDAQTTLGGPQYQLQVLLEIDGSCTGQTVAAQSIEGMQPQKSTISLRYCAG
jgi:eukaryotic-like serine/threonine-protein kinase